MNNQKEKKEKETEETKPKQDLLTEMAKLEYTQISEDWRHRDNLTWQLPSVIVIIGGALIAAAFGLNIDSQDLSIIRPILLGFGFLLALCMTVTLSGNLLYQIGSTVALERIIKGDWEEYLQNKQRRAISPKDFGLSTWVVIKKLSILKGSTFLLILCIIITSILFGLFIVAVIAFLTS